MSLDDTQLRILSHYADGTELKNIAQILDMDRDDVLGVVGDLVGFERRKAGELVRRHGRGMPAVSVSVLDREPPRAIHKSEPPVEPSPTEPRPPGYCDCGLADVPANEGLHRPHCSRFRAATTPVPVVPTEPAPQLAGDPDAATEVGTRPAGGLAPLEDILLRAAQAGGHLARKAEKIRGQIVALKADLTEQQRVRDAEARVQRLRRQLDDANAKLRELKGGPSPTKAAARGGEAAERRAIREWARANAVDCPSHGVVPRRVAAAWRAAQNGAAS